MGALADTWHSFVYGAPPGCGLVDPFWRRLPTLIAVGVFAGQDARMCGVTVPLDHPVLMTYACGGLAGAIAHHILRYVVDLRHSHCETCDRCSVADVPALRSEAAERDALRAHGWQPEAMTPHYSGGFVALCPAHANDLPSLHREGGGTHDSYP